MGSTRPQKQADAPSPGCHACCWVLALESLLGNPATRPLLSIISGVEQAAMLRAWAMSTSNSEVEGGGYGRQATETVACSALHRPPHPVHGVYLHILVSLAEVEGAQDQMGVGVLISLVLKTRSVHDAP